MRSASQSGRIAVVLRFCLHHIGKIFFAVVFLAALAVLTIPTLSLEAGSICFGGVPSLYNLTVAQFLFERSVTPHFFQRTPRYAHHQLSRTYFIQGDLYAAAEEAEKELAMYPDDTRTYYILGLTYGYMGREEDAIAAFSHYIDAYPGSWPARNDKAWLQFRIGDIDGALATVEPIAADFRYTVWVQNTYCALLLNKGRYADAERACLYAKEDASKMNEADWGRSYPGNDPRVYAAGLRAMKLSIDNNLALIRRNFGYSSTTAQDTLRDNTP